MLGGKSPTEDAKNVLLDSANKLCYHAVVERGLRGLSQFFSSMSGAHDKFKCWLRVEMENNGVYLTPEGIINLEEELEHLREVRRKEVAERLHEAMEDGELIENAEYEAAKNEQAFVEGRILEIERMLAQAIIIEPDEDAEHVVIGSTVVIKDGSKKSETYTIVGAAEADPKEGLISNESPLGRALLDKKVGQRVDVQAPAGDLRFKVIKIK